MRGRRFREGLIVAALAALVVVGGAARALLADCGPFADIGLGPPNFCPFILEIYYLGITAGTSPTTYSPGDPVTRGQMAVFLAKSFDQALRRAGRRGAQGRFWVPQNAVVLGVTAAPDAAGVASDGEDIWVAQQFPTHSVARVHASDGRLLGTWTGATRAVDVAVAMGRIVVAGNTSPGALYLIDPADPPGAVTTAANDLGDFPTAIAFDGARFWTINASGTISIVTPALSPPWTTATLGTFANPRGILFDGSSIWVTDTSAGLLRLDSNGAVIQTVPIVSPLQPVFDGTNVWVPGNSGELSVVRASTGAVLDTLTGNGLSGAYAAAFDGERILVTNQSGASVSLWKAADLTPLGTLSIGAGAAPRRACSDGLDFWIADPTRGLVRF
jgi:hypothetical protein